MIGVAAFQTEYMLNGSRTRIALEMRAANATSDNPSYVTAVLIGVCGWMLSVQLDKEDKPRKQILGYVGV